MKRTKLLQKKKKNSYRIQFNWTYLFWNAKHLSEVEQLICMYCDQSNANYNCGSFLFQRSNTRKKKHGSFYEIYSLIEKSGIFGGLS